MSPFAVCAFAVASAGIIAVIRVLRPELASLAGALAGILIFVSIVEGLAPFLDFVNNAAQETGAGGYFAVMLKALAISLCCKMSSEICKDCGENAMASRVELGGKAGIVIISLPILQQLFDIAKDMMQ